MVSTPAGDIAAAVRAARAIERWGSGRQWRGPDPYDALNATRLPEIARRSPLALRVVTQAVKRSPGTSVRSSASLTASAPRRSPTSSRPMPETASSTRTRHDPSCANASAGWPDCGARRFVEPCWGYHFDVQTRVFFYPRTTPNTIATAFAGLGLLDAHELAAAPDALEMAIGAGEFFLRHVPQTEASPGAYFGYLPGDRTPIHNANMLVAALLARLGRFTGRQDFADVARAAVEYTVARQRADGAWLYGEDRGLAWVDGFHTGYVLDCVLACIDAGVGGAAAEQAWRRGLRYYVAALIEPDGTPRYTPNIRHPIDGQCARRRSRRWLAPPGANRIWPRPAGPSSTSFSAE